MYICMWVCIYRFGLMDSNYFIGLKFITVFIYSDAQTVPHFISRNTFKVAPVS